MSTLGAGELFEARDLWLALLFGLVWAAALAIAPRERRHALRLGILYLASLALHAASGLLGGAGLPGAPAVHLVAALLSGIAAIGLLGVLLFGAALPTLRIQPSKILRDLATALSCLAYFLWLLSTRHVDVAGIVATSAVITAVIGLSLQDFLTNVMGGLALEVDGSIRVGDWVTFGEARGAVKEISWRHTAIETNNGDTLVVPNNVLMRTPVLRLGRKVGGGPVAQRRWIRFSVEDRIPPTAVVAAAEEALRRERIPNVAAEPAADVVFMGTRDGSCEYASRYWLTDLRADDSTDSTVRTRIWFALKRGGMPLAIPVSNVHLWSEEGLRTRQTVEAERAARREAVGRVPAFATLTPEEKERLAEGLLFTPFAAGEAIVLQGAVANHLYILTKGSAEVRVAVEGAAPRPLATLSAPDVFGEMGMLTGEPRRATVVAREETECWRLTKEAFHGILAARPALAEEISRLLAERDVELAAAREGLSEEAKRARLRDEQRSLVSKIRGFFGIG
ncbi:MAG TPA: mechanosensitive ion channel family protein [Thermoanaerobaculia bacterium]|nr:mechanosensitive ion channel family protein [Thermoanaerobaculia bacterium]HQR66334.1 mechanosensitive ion channel family protein [Thermoanaerobaculia bacterium]